MTSMKLGAVGVLQQLEQAARLVQRNLEEFEYYTGVDFRVWVGSRLTDREGPSADRLEGIVFGFGRGDKRRVTNLVETSAVDIDQFVSFCLVAPGGYLPGPEARPGMVECWEPLRPVLEQLRPMRWYRVTPVDCSEDGWSSDDAEETYAAVVGGIPVVLQLAWNSLE